MEFNKENILSFLFIVFLIVKFHIPEPVADMVDTLPGKFAVVVIAIMLFGYANPVLGVLGLFVAFDLIRRSSMTTGIDALQRFLPTEESKSYDFPSKN